ncbi:MAG: GNAT family N-acetyltransferase [Christensenellales bacterium]
MDWCYEEGRIYSENEAGELMAEATYVRRENGEIEIDHTYVNPVLRGQGVAGKMMEAIVAYLRKTGQKAAATCSYAHEWFNRNEESCADILSADAKDQAAACKINGKH